MQKLFLPILFAGIMCNTHTMELNRMELPSAKVDETTLLHCAIMQKMKPCVELMMHLENTGCLIRDTSNTVMSDLFALYSQSYNKEITDLARGLKQYHRIPAGMQLIETLYKTHGPHFGGILLKIAVKNSIKSLHKQLGNKVDGMYLTYFCRRHKKFPGIIEMILWAEGDDAIDAIAWGYRVHRASFDQESPWHEAVRDDNVELIAIFTQWAISHKQMNFLLSSWAIEFAALNGNVALVQLLLEYAEKLDLTQSLLRKKNGSKICPDKNRDEILALLNPYYERIYKS